MKAELCLVAVACAVIAANVLPAARAEVAVGLPRLGAYDPHGMLANEKAVAIDHVFVDWRDPGAEAVGEAVSRAAGRERQLMVTIEPWTRAANGRDGRDGLLNETVRGGFDAEIGAVCRAIGSATSPVIVTWGHEMDEREGRFPWAGQTPEDYKAAYRHFVDTCRTYAPTARFGWTAKGEPSFASYYPGSDHVDFVGLTLFDLQGWNVDHRDTRTFADRFAELRESVVDFGKPIILAEFGIAGDEAYRDAALACAREDLRRFPDVAALIYFNDVETWPWPQHYGRPDWRIDNASMFQCRKLDSVG